MAPVFINEVCLAIHLWGSSVCLSWKHTESIKCVYFKIHKCSNDQKLRASNDESHTQVASAVCVLFSLGVQTEANTKQTPPTTVPNWNLQVKHCCIIVIV